MIDTKSSPLRLSSRQDFYKGLIGKLGVFTGGILLGTASGGAVYLSAQAIGIVTATNAMTLGLLFIALSAVLAVSWGLIYFKDIGEALVPLTVLDSQQKAIEKFNKEADKALTLTKWLPPIKNKNKDKDKDNTPLKRNESIESLPEMSKNPHSLSKDQLLHVMIINYYIAKQLIKDFKEWKFASSLSATDKMIREALEQKSYTPEKTWNDKDAVKFIENLKHRKGHGKYAYYAYNSLKENNDIKFIVEKNLGQLLSRIKIEPHTTEADLITHMNDYICFFNDEHRSVKASEEFDERQFQALQVRYMLKLKSRSITDRVIIKLADMIAVANALLVNSAGLGCAGFSITNAVLNTFGITMSLTAAYSAFALFATGGFAGAFFLTRNTSKQAFRKLLNSFRVNNTSVSSHSKIIEERENSNASNEYTNWVKGKTPLAAKIILAVLCSIGFAGFNLITGMTFMAYIMNPASILDSHLTATLVSTSQPWYVIGSGIFSAIVTFSVVFPFMMKFSTDKTPKDSAKSSKTNSGIMSDSWILLSTLLNAGVAAAGYFSGSLWQEGIWHQMLGVTSPLVVNTFGVAVVLSVLLMGKPVFDVLKERISDIFPQNVDNGKKSSHTPSDDILKSEKVFVYNLSSEKPSDDSVPTQDPVLGQ
tara:strand:+ start:3584 stop:5530 length:1947 start_codon:yes stop_codon:yes gene_type:complete